MAQAEKIHETKSEANDVERMVRHDAPSERDFLREFEAKRGMGACICEAQEISAVLDEIEKLRSHLLIEREAQVKKLDAINCAFNKLREAISA